MLRLAIELLILLRIDHWLLQCRLISVELSVRRHGSLFLILIVKWSLVIIRGGSISKPAGRWYLSLHKWIAPVWETYLLLLGIVRIRRLMVSSAHASLAWSSAVLIVWLIPSALVLVPTRVRIRSVSGLRGTSAVVTAVVTRIPFSITFSLVYLVLVVTTIVVLVLLSRGETSSSLLLCHWWMIISHIRISAKRSCIFRLYWRKLCMDFLYCET